MIQLKLYENKGTVDEVQTWIDLYETEPIKLTISVEDITKPDATSTYSKTFKVPGTRNNAEFFKNAYDVDGILYDVTIKKPAEILVDGAQFKAGHIRLQRVYYNTLEDRYDYELLFLGETRDLASIIGDRGLCELEMNDLIGDPGNTLLTEVGIQQSWQAYPQGALLTDGLHNGNIIYPLIDFGNTYNSAGVPQEAEIRLSSAAHSKPFTNSSYPLLANRFKPMIRAKRIWDQIFADAGKTYTSTFLTSDLFHQIYISAFGNEATVLAGASSGPNTINVAYGENRIANQTTAISPLDVSQNQTDPGNNLSNTLYTIPVGGTYTFEGRCYYDGYNEDSSFQRFPVTAKLQLFNYTTSTLIAESAPGYKQTISFTYTGVFNTGDDIGIRVTPQTFVDWSVVTDVLFRCQSAPGLSTPAAFLECSYKQIDFIKDILTAFRLTLAPDPNNTDNFIIEPWQTYITSGDLYDWSEKLVQNKDVQIEPVFFSQSDEIEFNLQLGGDYVSTYHQQSYSETYGYLKFSSNNDLLKGTKEVTLTGIASTPITQIQGADIAGGDNIALPQLHQHDEGQHLPIKTKTRMLFYNGLQPFTHPTQNRWYLDGAGAQLNYPLVSPYQEWPIAPQTLNLNWSNDVQYWGDITGYNDEGSTLYSDYWSRYISSVYGKYTRRVTAYFILNNLDLQYFSFDDVIFINGTYYRPEKIIDVEIGAYTEVKVQLLTANDYTARATNQSLTNFSALGVAPLCANGTGSINVTTDGVPPLQWQLSTGQTGTLTPTGTAPYTFTINSVAAGTVTLNVQDSVGRTNSTPVTVPVSTATAPIPAISTLDANNCVAPCDGDISVIPNGGSGAPYQIHWLDDPTITTFNRTVCPGNYKLYITDSNGCPSKTYLAIVNCNATGPMFSTADETGGEPNQFDPCPMPNMFDVYSPITSDPSTLLVGDFIYFDSLYLQGFDGANLWYGLGTVNGSPSSLRSFKIDSDGEIVSITTC